MSKIMFVGDIHFTSKSPASRKETNEQYRQLLLNKVDNIKEICLNKGINTVIILGDVFNNNSGITNYFETEIWAKLLEFKANNIDLYTIIGNHDEIFQNEGEFKGSYLYKAFLAGIIKHLDKLTVDNVYIKGVDYNKDFPQCEEYCKYSICVAHCFYENERFGGIGNGNLTHQKCIDLGYTAYVLGHDHTPYETVVISGYYVIRPGSLTRGTSKTCNLYRKVTVAVFDTESLTWSNEIINTKPGTEVFNEKVIMSKDLDLNLTKLLENFQASKGLNIYDIIDQHEEQGRILLKDKYDPVIDLIIKNCEAFGIYRRLED